MKSLITALLIAGTCVGAFGGARLPRAEVLVTGIGLLLLAVAGVLALLERRKLSRQLIGSTGGGDVLQLIRELPAKLDPLVAEADGLTLEQLGERIAELSPDYFQAIADGAPALLDPMGATRFAEVFGVYANGERLISRAWSAAVDHHRPEALASLREGTRRIKLAVAALDAASPPAA